MSAYLLNFAVFWGVWLIVPILVDGMTTLLGLAGVLAGHLARRRLKLDLQPVVHPFVSIIVPVYNSGATLEALLQSVGIQHYPRDRMEVVLVNNGSTDNSYEVFLKMTDRLNVNLYWHSINAQGKAWALNAGIHLAQGQYIFNIDSDVVLAPDAIAQTVAFLEAQPDVGSTTGFLVILPPEEGASPGRKIMTSCEFLEYVSAFGVGRSYQTFLRAVYTLSGAYSVFRREALNRTFMYSKDTVSEDTDLTFQLYERAPSYRVANLPEAKIYLQPIESLAALYAQRVRWQRGQMEVSARYQQLLRRPVWHLFGLAPTRALLIDHTLSFPRLVWMVFMPVLLAYGYSLPLLVGAYGVVYLFYLLVELAWFGAAYAFADAEIRSRIVEHWYFLPLMPLYRIMVFFFRFSGFLHAVAEPRTWRVPDPLEQVQAGIADLKSRLGRLGARLIHPPPPGP